MEQLDVGTFFSKRCITLPLQQNTDNNALARSAAQIVGFSGEHHSIQCILSDNVQHFAKSCLYLEEKGLHIPMNFIFQQYFLFFLISIYWKLSTGPLVF